MLFIYFAPPCLGLEIGPFFFDGLGLKDGPTVVDKGTELSGLTCVATGGVDTVISFSFTSTLLRNNNYQCHAELPDGCSSTHSVIASQCEMEGSNPTE